MPKRSIIGLHCSPENEKLVLGAAMMDATLFPAIAQVLDEVDFTDFRHVAIFNAMRELQTNGVVIDRLTLANCLIQRSEYEGVGAGFLADLDTGLPANFSPQTLAAYLGIIKEKSRLRQIIRSAQEALKKANLADAVSVDVLREALLDFQTITDTLDTRGQMVSEYVKSYKGGLNVLLDPSKWEKGLPTGFGTLDDWTDGFHPSEIFLIGARPGAGKSSIGLNISRYLAAMGNLVVFFSLEMSKQICLNRLICENARISFQRFRRGMLTEDERRLLLPATSAVAALPIFIDDSSGLTTSDINMRLQSVASKTPVALCVIDYVQLLRGVKGKRYSTENERYEEIATDLQNLTKRTRIPLLLLSQLSRESEKGADKRPRISQMRGSGAWEQVANVGACIFREEQTKKERPDLSGVAELLIEKNRSGPTGVIALRYLKQLMSFEDS